jgi:hypothetical protein
MNRYIKIIYFIYLLPALSFINIGGADGLPALIRERKNMKNFKNFRILAFLVLVCLCAASALGQSHDHPHTEPNGGKDTDAYGFHGMVLFGSQSTYAYHLPMFHAPHNYQALFSVALEPKSPGGSAYKKLVKDHPAGIYTIAPKDLFDLEEMIDGKIEKFKADVYQGHFEKEGAVKLGEATVYVHNKIFSKDISNPGVSGPRWIEQKYLVFGTQYKSFSELYAMHVVTSSPSYDAIFKVSEVFAPEPITPVPVCKKRVCPDWQYKHRWPLDPPCNKKFCPEIPMLSKTVKKFVSFGVLYDLAVPKEVINGSFKPTYKILDAIYLDDADLNPQGMPGFE